MTRVEPLRPAGEPDAEARELAAEGAFRRVRDCAEFLGVCREQVYKLIRTGALRTSLVGGKRVVLKASAVRLLAQNVEP